MSLIVAKKIKGGFEVAADTGVYCGDFKCSNPVSKIAITPWGIVGSTGYEAQEQMFLEYCKSHEPAGTSIADFAKFCKDFEDYFDANSPHACNKTNSGHSRQEYIICYKDKIFCSDDCNCFDFACIGQQTAAEAIMHVCPHFSAYDVCDKAVDITVWTSRPIDCITLVDGSWHQLRRI